MTKSNRRRITYTALSALTVVVGLLVHYQQSLLHGSARDIAGDALWATMIAFAFSALAIGLNSTARYVAALSICYAVEFSQLWHTPILDHLRATRLGPLVLGSGFDPRDLIAYALGVLLFACIDQRWILRSPHQPP